MSEKSAKLQDYKNTLRVIYGITLRSVAGKWRINYVGAGERSAQYIDTLENAFVMGRAMSAVDKARKARYEWEPIERMIR